MGKFQVGTITEILSPINAMMAINFPGEVNEIARLMGPGMEHARVVSVSRQIFIYPHVSVCLRPFQYGDMLVCIKKK